MGQALTGNTRLGGDGRLNRDARLTALDTAFLCLESGPAPMHLGALAIFEPTEPLTPARLVALLSERAARLPWLRRRVGAGWLPPGSGVWIEDPLFNARRHIHQHQLDTGDHDEVSALAAELMADPLALNRPLWQLHLLTGLPDGRFGLLVKFHHALADGLRAAELGIGLLDGFTDAAAQASPPPTIANTPSLDVFGLARSAAGLLSQPDRLLGHVAGAAANLPLVARQLADVAGIASSVISNARLNAPGSPLANAALAGTPGAGRNLAMLRLDLAEVRQIRRRHGGTDNDVLLAIIAGALRDWLVYRGEPVDNLNVRALIPVSRRARPDEPGRRNLLSGYLCELPVHDGGPLSRLAAVRATMDRNKAAGPGRGAGALPVLADRVPAAMHRVMGPLTRGGAGRLFDTMVTNVPIPALPLALHGAPLREVYPIGPLPQGHSLGIAMSSHRGAVHIGLHSNGTRPDDLQRLAKSVAAELANLAAASQT